MAFATVTPSFVILGEPNGCAITTLRPLGPRVTPTASAKRLHPEKKQKKTNPQIKGGVFYYKNDIKKNSQLAKRRSSEKEKHKINQIL